MAYHLQSHIVHVLDTRVIKLCSLDLVFSNFAGPSKGGERKDCTSNKHRDMLPGDRFDRQVLRIFTQQLDNTSLYLACPT
jgi:hypothetical protein